MEHPRPSLTTVDHDILVMIIDFLADDHPGSMPSVWLVNSEWHSIARRSRHRCTMLDFIEHPATAKRSMDYVKEANLLSAIRRLEIRYPETNDTLGKDRLVYQPRHLNENVWRDVSKKVPKPEQISRLLPQMFGLREIWWRSSNPPLEIIMALRTSCPKVRLHATILAGDRNLNPMKSSNIGLHHMISHPNLTSLNVEAGYIQQKNYWLNLTRPLKEVLMSCPNLRSLTLNIGLESGGVECLPPIDYCGLGFANGEKPVALEELNLIDYPFGQPYARTIVGYPEKVCEEDYWIENFDWSRTRNLQLSRVSMALGLTPKLTALKEVVLTCTSGPVEYGKSISELFTKVPTSLESIQAPDIGYPTVAGILMHSSSLRTLKLHQPEKMQEGDTSWRAAAISEHSLRQIQEHCPKMVEMELDIDREGDWPWETFNIIARFSQLKCLTIWFELGVRDPESPVKPYTTFDAAGMIFEYLRDTSPTQQSLLATLKIHSGTPPPPPPRVIPGRGRIYTSPWWRDQSSSFDCALSDRNDEAAKSTFQVVCPDLSEEENETVRNGFKPFSKAHLDRIDPQRRRMRRMVLAHHGPMPYSQWDPHSTTPLFSHLFQAND